MKFGICTDVGNSPAMRAAGWDFVEENVQTRLKGRLADADWRGREEVARSALPVLVANCLVPGDLKIVGPDVDPEALRQYMTNVIRRAAAVGIKTLVFGSGAARNVPIGFDHSAAREQILDFLRMSASLAEQAGVTIVVEPLNRRECNIINTVAEAIQYVLAVDHARVACLVDTYHLWLQEEPVDHVRQAGAAIRHVHVADKNGRLAPGESGQSDYRPVFAALKSIGYAGAISVEGNFPDIAGRGRDVLAFLRKQWDDAWATK
jgi:sugar phosphate isomerase/epimerase